MMMWGYRLHRSPMKGCDAVNLKKLITSRARNAVKTLGPLLKGLKVCG